MTEVSGNWNQARIEQYISDGTEESLTLDYKAAASLAKTDGKKAEITKDVSAMANSAGGVIIYGVAEYKDKTREHLPERIDPVDRTQFSKEWLEHVISNVQPKIDGIVIHPVSIDTAPNHVVYVVEIPQSYTAHQAKDMRYYRRFNFESVPMVDYEIRDVMGRRQHARIELEFTILIRTVTESSLYDSFPSYDPFGRKKEPKKHNVYKLKIRMVNTGKVYAQYAEAFIEMPCALIYNYRAEYLERTRGPREVNLDQYCTYSRDNTVRDFIKGGGGFEPTEYGPARHVPILPGISLKLDDYRLTKDFGEIDWGDRLIRWTTHVDNAPPHSGEIAIKDIEVNDRRSSPLDDFDDLDDD